MIVVFSKIDSQKEELIIYGVHHYKGNDGTYGFFHFVNTNFYEYMSSG